MHQGAGSVVLFFCTTKPVPRYISKQYVKGTAPVDRADYSWAKRTVPVDRSVFITQFV